MGLFRKEIDYKWVALSNTTIAMFMASVDGTIVMVALPAIFKGINVDPLASFQYMLWMLMGYGVVTATLLLSCGRLSDMYGRVRFFNVGFAVFAAGSLLLFLTPSMGDAGAIELISFRLVQAVGASFIFSNSAAILTDAFPVDERGKALGINQVAALSGQFIGLVLGGILAVYDWRYVFLISVPFSTFGALWSFLKLKEISQRAPAQKIDIVGNLMFVSGLTTLLIAVTYGLMPYGDDPMGWSSPWVIAGLIAGTVLLMLFPVVESRVGHPMFRLGLFRIQAFAFANIAGFLGAIARGGLMFILIMLLQGIWLPLHGYSYESTPFWAGIYMLPLSAGFVIMGPVSGWLSDKYGARWISTMGMLLVAAAFIILALLPYNFDYPQFALALLLMGMGNGMFSSPNIASIMNSVPPEERGVASGMRSTLQNTAMTSSMAMFFTIIIVSLTSEFPPAMARSLSSAGAQQLIPIMNNIPPTSALFAAFLGYNPVQILLKSLPASTMNMISPETLSTLTGITWFPHTLAQAFMPSLRISFIIGIVLSLTAAVLSALRGAKYTYQPESTQKQTTTK
ncbi:MAG TPA: MFS transporter [Methanocella sp.]|nr:MFS transporter [Methanocella sp.]